VAGEIDRDALNVVSEPIGDRSPRRAIEGEAVEQYDGHATAAALIGQIRLLNR
jgi:hypothetical protein